VGGYQDGCPGPIVARVASQPAAVPADGNRLASPDTDASSSQPTEMM